MTSTLQPDPSMIGGVPKVPLAHLPDPGALFARRAERFARRLQGRSRLPVALVDERYSSMEARQRMREARRGDGPPVDLRDGDDAYAAVVILEQFLAESASPDVTMSR